MKYLILLVLSSCGPQAYDLCTLKEPYKSVVEGYQPTQKAYFYSCMGVDAYIRCTSFDHCMDKWNVTKAQPDNGIVKGAMILGGAHIIGKVIK